MNYKLQALLRDYSAQTHSIAFDQGFLNQRNSTGLWDFHAVLSLQIYFSLKAEVLSSMLDVRLVIQIKIDFLNLIF